MSKSQARSQLVLFIAAVFLLETLAQPVMALQSSTNGHFTTSFASQNTPDAKNDGRALQNGMNRQMIEAMKTGFGGRDPAMRDLMSIDIDKISGLIPDSSNAPVDADPFFMRSQTWVDSNESPKAYSVQADERSTEIFLPGSTRKLVLNLPLRSLIKTEEYLFFTLQPKSDLFDRLSGVQNADGEGIFVIETALLGYHAQRKTPVPVFFLPIMGRGWRSQIQAVQIIEGDILAVSNRNEVIPFLMKDIREMIQISKINLDISVMISMTKRASDGKITGEPLLPAPGSTAFLGLVVTGLDTTRPGYNFFRDFRSVASADPSHRFDFDSKETLLAKLAIRLRSKFNLLHLLKPEAAHAQDAEDPVAKAIRRSAIFGSIVAITIVAAFVLKYKSPAIRQRLDEIRKYRRALDPETVDAERMKGFRDFMRIEGSILASIAQFPLISPGIAVQYLVDRYAPSLGAGDHTLMRKVLNQTVYPNLRHFGKISVNEKVTILGTGYAATAGIGLGALHSFYLLPMFVQSVSPSLPDGLGFALTETFNSQNRETQAQLFTNLLVGASIGVLRGPADLTMDAKSQVVEELHARVDNDLRRMGINPDDPKIQTRREHMREALINLTLVQKGLPTTAEILFDTMSLYSSVAKARGFTTPSPDTLTANLNPLAANTVEYEKEENGEFKLDAKGQRIITEGSFILSSRRGLLPSVLKRALDQAKAWHELNPSSDTANALRLVERMISDSERLRTILPKAAEALLRVMERQALKLNAADSTRFAANDAELNRLREGILEINSRALAFRQLLVLSNYEGPIEYTARYLPATWAKEFGSGATNMAVLYLRQALASQLDGSTVDNIAARPLDASIFQVRAKSKAIEDMKQQRPELMAMTDAAIMADADLRAQVLQRSNILIKSYGEERRAEEKAGKFKPASGWLEHWQHRRATDRAAIRIAQYSVAHADQPELLKKENLEARLREFYTHESAKQIGLHIQDLAPENESEQRGSGRAPWQSNRAKYDAMIQEIREKSELLAGRQFATLNMKTYLSKLSPENQLQVKMQLHAAIFIAAYRDATTMNEMISPVDSAQPGFTQRARQALTRQTENDLATLDAIEAEKSSEIGRKIVRIRAGVVSLSAGVANRGLRVIDSMFHDQAVDRGVLGIIQRRVPFAEEMVSANMRNLKFWPVAFTVSWVWSHYALGTGVGYSFWVTAILTQGIFAMAPVQWLFRNYRMQAFKPYDTNKKGWSGVFQLGGKYGTTEALAYAATFIAIMPAILMTTEIGALLTTSIGMPVERAMHNFSMIEVSGAVLTGLLSYIAGSKALERWKMKRTTARLAKLNDSSVEMAKSAGVGDLRSRPTGAGPNCEALFISTGH